MLAELLTKAQSSGNHIQFATAQVAKNLSNAELVSLKDEINNKRFNMFLDNLDSDDEEDAKFARQSAEKIIAGRLEMMSRGE